MLRIRRFEEKCAELYSAGLIRGFLHLYIGEEAVAVGTMAALTSEDAIVATYREHGHALARGVDANPLPVFPRHRPAYGSCTGGGRPHHGRQRHSVRPGVGERRLLRTDEHRPDGPR